MGVSFTPETWEKLRDLRERHEAAARRSDETQQRLLSGEVSRAEYEDAVRREREAYAAWRLTKIDDIGESVSANPDHDEPEIPRDR